MADLLDRMVPACQQTISTNMDPFFKIYRDDGLGITFESPDVIIKILEFFNNFEPSIQWTIPTCPVCHQPYVLCPHYNYLEFLDCKITWKKVPKGDLFIWQFQVSSFSKPTDCHAYLSPSSCSSPHLTKLGISLAKTVGMRLRAIHSNDYDLLASLNEYSGYMVARGYKEESIKFHLSAMANRSRNMVLKGEYRPPPQFSVPFVSTLHPATTVLSKLVKTCFSQAASLDNILEFIIPKSSLLVTYRKLPNLQLLLCKNDQNQLATSSPTPVTSGYTDIGCKCLVCKASLFSKFVNPPSMPGYSVRIPGLTSCKSGPAVVYHLSCKSGRKECNLAHYVGRASTSSNKVQAMASRWANHKSHFKKGHDFCAMTTHLLNFHRGEDPQKFISIQILQSAQSVEEAKQFEIIWTRKLFAYFPSGLNVREEDPVAGV